MNFSMNLLTLAAMSFPFEVYFWSWDFFWNWHMYINLG